MKRWTQEEDAILKRNYPKFGSDTNLWDSQIQRTQRAIQRRAGIINAPLVIDHDITSHKFGRLTAIKKVGVDKHRNTLWLCECECGNTTVVPAYALRNGHSKSCGCIGIDFLKTAKPSTKHGGARVGKNKERLYRVWLGMKERCYNPHSRNYMNYGGRGITICDEWLHDFSAFRDWAMANGYNPDAPRGQCTIDRIDNDGNYEPSNCRWVDMKTQANNKKHVA